MHSSSDIGTVMVGPHQLATRLCTTIAEYHLYKEINKIKSKAIHTNYNNPYMSCWVM